MFPVGCMDGASYPIAFLHSLGGGLSDKEPKTKAETQENLCALPRNLYF